MPFEGILKTSLRTKIILLSCALALISSVAVVWLNYSDTQQKLSLQDARAELSLATQNATIRIEEDLLSIVEDAQILANTPPIPAIIDIRNNNKTINEDATEAIWRHRLESIFMSVMEVRPAYTQIRFIGYRDNGREIVRVDRENRTLKRIAPSDFQNRKGEGFLENVTNLKAGETLFSEKTHQNGPATDSSLPSAIIHLTVPVFDKNGEPFGTVIINADYAALIKKSVQRMTPEFDMLIANNSGDLLQYDIHTSQMTFYDAQSAPANLKHFVEQSIAAPMGGLHASNDKLYYLGNESRFQNVKGLTIFVLPAIETRAVTLNSYNQTILAMAFVVLSLVLAGVYAGHMTRPLRRMTRRIQQFSDWSDGTKLDLPVSNRDEIGDLARAFSNLIRELQENRDRTEKIITNVVDGIIVIDEHGTIETFNPACERFFGYKAAEVIGKNVTMLMSEENARHHGDYLRNYARTGRARFIGKGREIKARRKSGEAFVIDISVSEVTEGGRHYFCGIVRDMTEIIESRNVVKKQKETLEFALEGGDLGLWDFDLRTKAFSISQICANFIGYNAEDFEGNRLAWEALIAPEDLIPKRQLLQDIEDGLIDRYEMEFRIQHKNGHWVWLQSKGKVFEQDNLHTPTRLVGIHVDITERKQMEIMKDEFVSTVNHELRTPLTTIFGSLDLLQHLAKEQMDLRGQRLVNLAHDSCGRLTHLVDDILDLEKIAAGKMEYVVEPHDLKALVTDIVEQNQALADRFNVNFEIDHQIGPVKVDVDDNRFRQALVNLLSNASKFSPPRAPVTVTTRMLDAQTVRVSVADCGPGIPEKFQNRIFERFAQADSSTTRRTAGTGLGLNITKSIIEAFSGEVSFETRAGLGTTFHFDLPVREAIARPVLEAV